jgi:hypothetical protein
VATDLQNLATRKSAILAELAAITSTANGGKPTYNIDGQMVDHTQYRLSLYEELEAIDRRIAAADGPSENVLQAVT